MTCLHNNKKIIANYKKHCFYLCNDCRLVFNKDTFEQKFEEKKYDDFYEETGRRFFPIIEYVVIAFRFLKALVIAIRYPKAKSILDIGSGRGYMLFFLKKYFGFKTAIGTQVSRPAFLFSKNKLGLDVYDQDLLTIDFNSQQFDVITIFHVLEHLKNPDAYIAKINSLLKPGGKIIIEVPNFNSWTKKLTGCYWLGLDFQHHIFFFDPSTLKILLKKHNFNILKINTFSWEYSAFTSAQSLLSWLTKSDHIFYNFIQTKNISLVAVAHFLFFILLFILCLIVNLFLFFSLKGENLRITAMK